jgi:hypothetical protein
MSRHSASSRTPSGPSVLAALVACLVAVLLGTAACDAGGDGAVGSLAPGSRTHRAPAPTHRAAGHRQGSAGTALAALDALPVKGRAPMTGYDRDEFGPAWTDDNDDPLGHNGCDTRNDILRRDLTQVVLEPGTNGCVVLTGVLDDPYDGSPMAFERGPSTSIEVEIDHVVALGDAWQTGAQQWSDRKRRDFANDPLELLAVDLHDNDSKGDGDAATWLPPYKAYRCAYVARQIAVKRRWGLWVKPAEKAAMQHILEACPGQPLLREAGPAPS